MSDIKLKVPLPGGRLYPGDVYAETFTWTDAREIAAATRQRDGQRVYGVVGRRLSMPVEDLIVHDFRHLTYWHLINSYAASPLRLGFPCPHCGASTSAEVTAAAIVSDDLAEDYAHDGTAIELPSRPGEHLPIRLQTIGDELTAARLAREHFRERPARGETIADALAALTLTPPGADDATVLARLREVRGVGDARALTADDLYAVMEFERDYRYGPRPYLRLACGACKEVADVGYELNIADFFPGPERGGVRRSRILSRPPAADAAPGAGRPGVHQAGDVQAPARGGAGDDASDARGGQERAAAQAGAALSGAGDDPRLEEFDPRFRSRRSMHATVEDATGDPALSAMPSRSGSRPPPGGDRYEPGRRDPHGEPARHDDAPRTVRPDELTRDR